MDLVFDPPHGVAPLRLGMTLQEAVAAAPREWGQASVLRRSEDDAMAEWTLDHVGVQAMAEEDGVVVTAIELWWPGEGRVFSTRVLLDGDEVFTTPAQEVFARRQPRLAGRHVAARVPRDPRRVPGFHPTDFPGGRAGRGQAATLCHLGPRRRQGLLRLPLRVIGDRGVRPG
ncbi:hypothetical protein WDA79_06030 [Streptomyces sp. A475]|uniref:hypothetical protein n=1 Tax=Streptomyces sp. A475 TaxID=3131976 RepID=UPI0030C8F674